MNQQQIALLFDTSKQLISHHITNILQDNELQENSVVKDYLTTATDGKPYGERNSRNTVPSLGYRALVRIFGQGFYNG